jgi:hypothetical protein
MSSSAYFGDFYQIGLVIEKKSDNIKDFMQYFFEQAYTKKNYWYQNVDPMAESGAVSRAFYLNNTEQAFTIYTGENFDYTEHATNYVENQSSVQSFKDLVPSMVGQDYS